MTGQPWDGAVADAAFSPPADATTALREEVEHLWGDLGDAYRMANDGMWSVGCAGLVTRIVRLTRMAGVTPWDHVNYALVLNGIYTGVLTSAGIAHGPPDLAAMRAHATMIGASQCGECSLWDGHHTKPCSRRSRSQYEIDQERLARFRA